MKSNPILLVFIFLFPMTVLTAQEGTELKIFNPTDVLLWADSYQKSKNITVKDYGPHVIHNVGVIRQPNEAAYVYRIAEEGEYYISVEYATKEKRPIKVTVDGNIVNDKALQSGTGGYEMKFVTWETIGTYNYTTGNHNLKLTSDDVFPHIRQIRLTLKKE